MHDLSIKDLLEKLGHWRSSCNALRAAILGIYFPIQINGEIETALAKVTGDWTLFYFFSQIAVAK